MKVEVRGPVAIRRWVLNSKYCLLSHCPAPVSLCYRTVGVVKSAAKMLRTPLTRYNTLRTEPSLGLRPVSTSLHCGTLPGDFNWRTCRAGSPGSRPTRRSFLSLYSSGVCGMKRCDESILRTQAVATVRTELSATRRASTVLTPL